MSLSRHPVRLRNLKDAKRRRLDSDSDSDSDCRVSAVEENCVVCLEKIDEVGILDCGHRNFCVSCIIDWSKITNSCPLCKKRFNAVYKASNTLVGKSFVEYVVDRRMPVPEEEQLMYEEEEEEDPVDCVVCGFSDREELLLLCDSCDSAWHTTCLRPPLRSVPDDAWFCPDCEAEARRAEQHFSSMQSAHSERESEEPLPREQVQVRAQGEQTTLSQYWASPVRDSVHSEAVDHDSIEKDEHVDLQLRSPPKPHRRRLNLGMSARVNYVNNNNAGSGGSASASTPSGAGAGVFERWAQVYRDNNHKTPPRWVAQRVYLPTESAQGQPAASSMLLTPTAESESD